MPRGWVPGQGQERYSACSQPYRDLGAVCATSSFANAALQMLASKERIRSGSSPASGTRLRPGGEDTRPALGSGCTVVDGVRSHTLAYSVLRTCRLKAPKPSGSASSRVGDRQRRGWHNSKRVANPIGPRAVQHAPCRRLGTASSNLKCEMYSTHALACARKQPDLHPGHRLCPVPEGTQLSRGCGVPGSDAA